jgi:hypothetical protein
MSIFSLMRIVVEKTEGCSKILAEVSSTVRSKREEKKKRKGLSKWERTTFIPSYLRYIVTRSQASD